jgi:hypothetical protein
MAYFFPLSALSGNVFQINGSITNITGTAITIFNSDRSYRREIRDGHTMATICRINAISLDGKLYYPEYIHISARIGAALTATLLTVGGRRIRLA